MCHLFQNAIFSAICIGHDICISADICILTVLFLNCVVYIHIERGMHKHHGTLIPLMQLRRRCSHSRCRVYTPFVPKLAFLQSLYFKHTIRRTSTNRHAHLLYCNCDMYICNALYILQLRYVYRHVYRHAYRHRTLYIATAICISAPHFIYCMYICNALYILQLRYVGFAPFAPSGKSGKSMNYEICTFCTKQQKRQKYESWGLHFLHQVVKVAKV